MLLVFQKIYLVQVQLKRISISTSHFELQIPSDNLFAKETDIIKPNSATVIQSAYFIMVMKTSKRKIVKTNITSESGYYHQF